MSVFRSRTLKITVGVAIAACSDEGRTGRADSTAAAADTVGSAISRPPPPGWSVGLGALVALPVDSTSGVLVFGDLDVVAGGLTTLRLIDPKGSAVTAEIVGTRSDGATCQLISVTPAPADWTVAISGPAIATTLRTAGDLTRADSQAAVTSLARLASVMPNDTTGRFAGLPFVVTQLWTGRLPDSTAILIGSLRRQLNQEASPLEERTFIVAERRDAEWVTVYSGRASGPEETVETMEALAIVLDPNPILVVSRDVGDGAAMALIAREGATWRRRFAGSPHRCPP
jgi:hypothetical protein